MRSNKFNLIFFIIILNLANISSAQVIINEKELLPVVIHSQWGFIDRTGKIVIQPQFSDVDEFSEGYAPVKIEGLWGYIDVKGQVVIKPQYNSAEKFSEGLAVIKINDEYGYINKTGEIIITPKFDYAEDFQNGIADVMVKSGNSKNSDDANNPKHLYIDKTGKYLTNLDVVTLCSEGMILVRDGHKKGFIDSTGKMIISPQFDDAQSFNEGLAVVKINDKWGCIDKTGKMVIPANYELVNDEFSEGLLGIKINDKWGYIDKTGKLIINADYDEVYLFSEGLASILINGKMGYIDKTGKVVVSPSCLKAYKFQDGIARVLGNYEIKEGNNKGLVDQRWLLIDKTGKQISNILAVKDVNRFEEGIACVKLLDNKYSYIDQNGNFITELKFDHAAPWFKNGVAKVHIGKKMGYIDKKGKYIWEPSE